MFTNEGLFNLEDTFKRFILLKLNFKERLWAGTLAHSCPWNIHIHGSQIILNTILFTSWVLSNKNLLPLMGICYLMICIFPSFHSFLSFYMQIDKSLWAWRCESICRRHSQLKEQTQVGVCSTAHRGLRGPHIDLEMTEEWGKIPRLGLASTSKFWFSSLEKFLVFEKNFLRRLESRLGLKIFFWEVSSLASTSKFSFDVFLLPLKHYWL